MVSGNHRRGEGVVADDAAVINETETTFPAWLTGPGSPLGPEAVILHGELLRRWGLSEVWRLRLGGPRPCSVVVKRGTGEMAEETRRYRELVVPLGLPSARVVTARGGADGEPAVLVLEDVGPDTLEQRPTAGGYREAVRTLARMRAVAADRLARDPATGTGLRRTTADFAETARRAAAGLAAVRPDLAGELDAPTDALLGRLDRLSGRSGTCPSGTREEAPATIVHGDFHAKNLVRGADGRIVPVDWPGAYAHAHLGDLYCLLREARKHGIAERVEASSLPGVFAREARLDPAAVRELMVAGGLCWTLIALRWVVEEGLRAVPGSAAWIDELVSDARSLAAGSPDRRVGA
jgi:Ser/Thr protein kinase RdoA (MazF antagonist)